MSQLQEGQGEPSDLHLPHGHRKALLVLLNENFDISFLGRKKRGGRWHVKGSKQGSEGTGTRELRTTDEILQLRKKAAQNKYKQMSKSERAKRRKQRSMLSHQAKTRTGKRRKR